MNSAVRFSDLDASHVPFWDGRERTQAELDSVLPGLFEYAKAHPRLAELTPPYNLRKEFTNWGLILIFILIFIAASVIATKFAFGLRFDLFWFVPIFFAATVGVGSRVLLGFDRSKYAPILVAQNGLFEVYKRGRYEQGPIWSTKLTDVEWRLGKGCQAESRKYNVLEGIRRQIVLVKRRRRGLLQNNEFYGCGWTPEMKMRWLALFQIIDEDRTGME